MNERLRLISLIASRIPRKPLRSSGSARGPRIGTKGFVIGESTSIVDELTEMEGQIDFVRILDSLVHRL